MGISTMNFIIQGFVRLFLNEIFSNKINYNYMEHTITWIILKIHFFKSFQCFVSKIKVDNCIQTFF